jgi:hypothetical protein
MSIIPLQRQYRSDIIRYVQFDECFPNGHVRYHLLHLHNGRHIVPATSGSIYHIRQLNKVCFCFFRFSLINFLSCTVPRKRMSACLLPDMKSAYMGRKLKPLIAYMEFPAIVEGLDVRTSMKIGHAFRRTNPPSCCPLFCCDVFDEATFDGIIAMDGCANAFVCCTMDAEISRTQRVSSFLIQKKISAHWDRGIGLCELVKWQLTTLLMGGGRLVPWHFAGSCRVDCCVPGSKNSHPFAFPQLSHVCVFFGA